MRILIIGGVAVLAVLIVAGGVVASLPSIVGAPVALTLADSRTGSAASGTGQPSGAAALDGIWNAAAGSIAGYRLQESVLGRQLTVSGRTSEVWGSIAMSGTSVRSGSFTASMASVMSGPTQRKVMDVNAYPTAAFVLTSPIELGSIPPDGAIRQLTGTGDLTMHGVTRAVAVTASARRSGSTISVLVDVPIVFADWNVSIPSSGAFGTPGSVGTIEVLMHLTQGPGNPASAGSSGGSSSGGPG